MRVEVRSSSPGGSGIPAVLIELAAERVTVRELIRRAVLDRARPADSRLTRGGHRLEHLSNMDSGPIGGS
jgi:hypothetical protein